MRVDPNYVSNLTTSLNQSSNAEALLTAELSSGLRVSSLSADPVAIAQSSTLNTTISQLDTYVQVASGETSRMQVADSTLGEVVTQLTSAISTGTQAANGTQSAANLTTLAGTLTGIRDTVVSLANTAYTGTYLFSGSNGTTQPYTVDTTTDPATTTYAGDSTVQSVVTPSGQSIQVSLAGSTVLTPVVNALNQLISDVSNGASSTTISTDTATLTTAMGQLSSQRAVLDTSLTKIQATSTYAQTQAAEVTAAESTLVSADTSDVATQLSASETQHQALLSVISGLDQQTNLFGYVK